jgi:hypothetical protein
MIRQHSIKTLYPFAIAEGEGVGTAYEYFTKRLLLARWLKQEERPRRRSAENLGFLIAGLPEKYGASLDFLLLASEMEAMITIADNRPQALTKAKAALAKAQDDGLMQNLEPEYCLAGSMGLMAEIDGRFDLALSSETLQRLPAGDRKQYVSRLLQLAPKVAIFTPNNDNPAHTNVSGLSGLRLDELGAIVEQGLELVNDSAQLSLQMGYIDMPPFPPGITRSEDQRDHAASGKGEAIAMWGLGQYAHLERWLPLSWRRSKSHIVYALIENPAA